MPTKLEWTKQYENATINNLDVKVPEEEEQTSKDVLKAFKCWWMDVNVMTYLKGGGHSTSERLILTARDIVFILPNSTYFTSRVFFLRITIFPLSTQFLSFGAICAYLHLVEEATQHFRRSIFSSFILFVFETIFPNQFSRSFKVALCFFFSHIFCIETIILSDQVFEFKWTPAHSYKRFLSFFLTCTLTMIIYKNEFPVNGIF